MHGKYEDTAGEGEEKRERNNTVKIKPIKLGEIILSNGF